MERIDRKRLPAVDLWNVLREAKRIFVCLPWKPERARFVQVVKDDVICCARCWIDAECANLPEVTRDEEGYVFLY